MGTEYIKMTSVIFYKTFVLNLLVLRVCTGNLGTILMALPSYVTLSFSFEVFNKLTLLCTFSVLIIV